MARVEGRTWISTHAGVEHYEVLEDRIRIGFWRQVTLSDSGVLPQYGSVLLMFDGTLAYECNNWTGSVESNGKPIPRYAHPEKSGDNVVGFSDAQLFWIPQLGHWVALIFVSTFNGALDRDGVGIFLDYPLEPMLVPGLQPPAAEEPAGLPAGHLLSRKMRLADIPVSGSC
jgi:hypothetical protein